MLSYREEKPKTRNKARGVVRDTRAEQTGISVFLYFARVSVKFGGKIRFQFGGKAVVFSGEVCSSVYEPEASRGVVIASKAAVIASSDQQRDVWECSAPAEGHSTHPISEVVLPDYETMYSCSSENSSEEAEAPPMEDVEVTLLADQIIQYHTAQNVENLDDMTVNNEFKEKLHTAQAWDSCDDIDAQFNNHQEYFDAAIPDHVYEGMGLGKDTCWQADTSSSIPVGYHREAPIFKAIFMPYSESIMGKMPTICHEANDLWTACVPLISWKCVEWHLPDKVMQQFGGIQSRTMEPMEREFCRVDGRDQAEVR
ncbi:hypothetical protein KFK09_011390 [Dendrobium nobile]|uniref:Uncharacterized protein n=1 Tax=Dendrobium nobile TaxID=94219 RepID=A0A8T3BFM1_DENNO|nr:hypothetical protein KFK09_011390 [Dendrobium nobile]